MPRKTSKQENTWIEEIEIAGGELVGRIKELIAEGNVRRLIIKKTDGDLLLEVPLTAGVAVGGVFTIVAPVLAAIGAMAALLAKVKVEVVRVDKSKRRRKV
jgi:phage-related minor tail protein